VEETLGTSANLASNLPSTTINSNSEGIVAPTTPTAQPLGLINPVDNVYAQQQTTTPSTSTPYSSISNNENTTLLNLVEQGSSKALSGTSGGLLDSINTFGNTYLGTGLTAAETGSAGVTAGTSGIGATEALGNGVIATPAQTAGVFGADSVAGAGAWTTTSLSGALGYAGIGYVGGGLLAGVLGENQVGGSIGGALGSFAGGLAGGALLGTELGSFAGPVGALAGGVLGSIVGGLFGNSKPSDETEVGLLSASNGSYSYQPGVSDQGSKYSSANVSTADSVGTGASNLAQWLIANGATPINNTTDANGNPTSSALVFKVGSRDGYQVLLQGGVNGVAPTTISNAGENLQNFQSNAASAVMSQYNIPAALQQQINANGGLNTNAFFGNYTSGTTNVYNNSANPVPETGTGIGTTPTIAPVGDKPTSVIAPANTVTPTTST
jgi:hypothetical protein